MDHRKEDWSEPPLAEEDVAERHLSDAELLGESEYSQRIAGGGEREQDPGSSRSPGREELTADPEDLGRRALEDATQSPPQEEEQGEQPAEPAGSRTHGRSKRDDRGQG